MTNQLVINFRLVIYNQHWMEGIFKDHTAASRYGFALVFSQVAKAIRLLVFQLAKSMSIIQMIFLVE